MHADLMMHFGWSLEKILWGLNTEQVFWWHDVLISRISGKTLERETDWKTADEIRAEFERDPQTGTWRVKKQNVS